MYNIGIIPARGGSKGIPLKNIKLMNGKPLIEYTIESAIKSGVLDKIVVSTDDEKIAEISSKYESIHISMRPPELATDDATTESTLIYVCEELKKQENIFVKSVITLEPTSPLRSPYTIRTCVELLQRPMVDSVVGVIEVSSVLGRIIDNKFEHIFPGQPRRRQDREDLYKESSTIYGTLYEVLLKKQSVIGDHAYPLVIPKQEALDINDNFDFLTIESLLINGVV
jgi:CMP-N,N'-diacetyllegionaminic acid synthase